MIDRYENEKILKYRDGKMAKPTDTKQEDVFNDKATFFSWLDLGREGLEKVSQAVEQTDYDLAAAELLTYFRNRKGIQ